MRRDSTTLWLVAILGVAALFRLVWILLTIRQPVGFFDPSFYFATAIDIAHGEGYRRGPGLPTAYFPPAYPFTLGGVFWLVSHTPLPNDRPASGLALNWALGVASVGFVYALARKLFDRTVALVAAGLVAVFPSLVFYTGTFFSETLFVFLALAALVVAAGTYSAAGRLPVSRLIAFGLLVGLASLTRAVGLVMLPALLLALWLGGAGPRAALTQVGVALAAALLVIGPWTGRNAVVMDAAVPIATNGGEDLCIGHNPAATGAFEINHRCQGPIDVPPARFEVASQHRGTKEAWRFARHHPGREVELLWHRARYTYENDSESLDAIEAYGHDRFIRHDVRHALGLLANVFFFVVAVLGLMGLRAFARRDPGRLLVLLSLLGFALAPLLFFGNPRFHVPAAPLLALSTAVALTGLARRPRA